MPWFVSSRSCVSEFILIESSHHAECVSVGFAVGMQLCVGCNPAVLSGPPLGSEGVAARHTKLRHRQTPRRQFSLCVDKSDPARTEKTFVVSPLHTFIFPMNFHR